MKELILISFEQKNFKVVAILLKVLDCEIIQNEFTEGVKDLNEDELLAMYEALIVGGYDEKSSKKILKGL